MSVRTENHPLHDLQKKLGYQFKNPGLLQQALTHRSHGSTHNERLEYLGDAVLDLAVAHMLYEALAQNPEGDLSRVRSALVKQSTLHQLALDLHLPKMIRLGSGESRSGGRNRPSILADTLEAIIGAIYLDSGFNEASALVHRLFGKIEIDAFMLEASKDSKTTLQEWLQGKRLPLPKYSILTIKGAAHQQVFEVQCHVESLNLSTRGEGNSRRVAEQAAAANFLKELRQNPPPLCYPAAKRSQ